jgi:hypothetical protein
LFDLRDPDCQRFGNFRCDPVLHIKDVGEGLLETSRPKYPAITIYKLRGYADAVPGAPNGAFDLIARLEMARDVFRRPHSRRGEWRSPAVPRGRLLICLGN